MVAVIIVWLYGGLIWLLCSLLVACYLLVGVVIWVGCLVLVIVLGFCINSVGGYALVVVYVLIFDGFLVV